MAARIMTSTSSTVSDPFTATVRDCLPLSNSHRYPPADPWRKLMHRWLRRSRGDAGLGIRLWPYRPIVLPSAAQPPRTTSGDLQFSRQSGSLEARTMTVTRRGLVDQVAQEIQDRVSLGEWSAGA